MPLQVPRCPGQSHGRGRSSPKHCRGLLDKRLQTDSSSGPVWLRSNSDKVVAWPPGGKNWILDALIEGTMGRISGEFKWNNGEVKDNTKVYS